MKVTGQRLRRRKTA